MIKNIRKFILGKKCRNIENGEITKEELQKLDCQPFFRQFL